ncbi:MAG: BNR-4 repeat-containing protein [Solirubrobacteraceae bacterium]
MWALSATAAHARIVTWAEGSWSWFGDPRAVQVGGATFVGWIDWSGRVTVGELDRRAGATRTVVIARVYHDDHSDPSILVEPDGRLTVFWSGHNGAHMYYRTTVNPSDIGRWARVRTLAQGIRGPDGFTYPNPVLLPPRPTACTCSGGAPTGAPISPRGHRRARGRVRGS